MTHARAQIVGRAGELRLLARAEEQRRMADAENALARARVGAESALDVAPPLPSVADDDDGDDGSAGGAAVRRAAMQARIVEGELWRVRERWRAAARRVGAGETRLCVFVCRPR